VLLPIFAGIEDTTKPTVCIDNQVILVMEVIALLCTRGALSNNDQFLVFQYSMSVFEFRNVDFHKRESFHSDPSNHSEGSIIHRKYRYSL
jgi:hypothetical protein